MRIRGAREAMLEKIAFGPNRNRHCERSETIQGNVVRLRPLDRRVASLLAMTIPSQPDML
jgi:hypothetical protein